MKGRVGKYANYIIIYFFDNFVYNDCGIVI